jgi:hypothetical protein
VDREQSQEGFLSISNRPDPPGHTKAVNALTARAGSRQNRFPSQPSIAVELLPFHLLDLAQRGQNGQRLSAFESEPGFLEHWIIQVEQDPRHGPITGAAS